MGNEVRNLQSVEFELPITCSELFREFNRNRYYIVQSDTQLFIAAIKTVHPVEQILLVLTDCFGRITDLDENQTHYTNEFHIYSETNKEEYKLFQCTENNYKKFKETLGKEWETVNEIMTKKGLKFD